MIILLCFINFFISFLLLYLSYPIFLKFLLDRPNERSSHIKPTPSGGGLIFGSISIISLFLVGNLRPLLLLPLVFIGLVDDKFQISSFTRFIFQVTTSFLLVYFCKNFYIFENIGNLNLIIVILFLTFFGTSIINFSNFVDGLDGLLAGTMCVIFVSLAILVDFRYLLVSTSLLGFLLWNWSPAKIFMGDGGSTFLGALFFSALLNSNNLSNFLVILLISSPIMLDPLICVVRRLVNKQPIFKSHKLHLYQRLNQSGWSHKKIASIYTLSSFLLLISYLVGGFILICISFFLLINFSNRLFKNASIAICFMCT